MLHSSVFGEGLGFWGVEHGMNSLYSGEALIDVLEFVVNEVGVLFEFVFFASQELVQFR